MIRIGHITDSHPEKPCTKCGETKSVGEFFRESRNASGFASACKQCRKGGRYGTRKRLLAERERLAIDGLRRCSHCKSVKPNAAFGTDRSRPDGLNIQCKSCVNAYGSCPRGREINRVAKARYYRKGGAEKQRIYRGTRTGQQARATALHNYAHSEKGRSAERRYYRGLRARHPGKIFARNAVHRSVRTGQLTKGPCEKCHTTVGIHGHHDDYNKPLTVRWLCRRHHADLHRGLR
jgi:hypothetical protein